MTPDIEPAALFECDGCGDDCTEVFETPDEGWLCPNCWAGEAAELLDEADSERPMITVELPESEPTGVGEVS